MPSAVSTSARGEVRPWITPTSLAEPMVNPLPPDASTRGAKGSRRPLASYGMGARVGPASGSLGATGGRGATAATGAGGGGGLPLPQPAIASEAAVAAASLRVFIASLRRPEREQAGRADPASPPEAERPPAGIRRS